MAEDKTPAIVDDLVTLGLPIPDATLVLLQRMLACVVRNLRAAEQRIRSPDGHTLHRRKRRWFTGTGRPRRPHEESVSAALAKEFEWIRRSSFRSCLEDFNFSIACEVPREREEGAGPASKPTDIRIYNWGRGSEAFDLRIEAKVVHQAADVRTYAGLEGMGRFFDEVEPYTSGLVGAMAAYALLDGPEDWHARIGTALLDAPPIQDTFLLRLEGAQAPVLVSLVTPREGSPLALRLLFHIVLEFDLDPPGRPGPTSVGPRQARRPGRRTPPATAA